LAVAVWAAETNPPPAATTARVAKPLPDFALRDLGGATLTKSNFGGQVMLVWIFASQDGPSRRQLPVIQQLHEAFAGRGVAVLGVAVDPKGVEPVRAFAAAEKIGFPIVMGEFDFLVACDRLEAVPTMYVVEAGGYVVSRHVGVTDYEKLATELEAALAMVRE
jgi:peroxiredoxin